MNFFVYLDPSITEPRTWTPAVILDLNSSPDGIWLRFSPPPKFANTDYQIETVKAELYFGREAAEAPLLMIQSKTIELVICVFKYF